MRLAAAVISPLGAEAMQKDLIPFILELCEETKVEPPRRLVDEVLTSSPRCSAAG